MLPVPSDELVARVEAAIKDSLVAGGVVGEYSESLGFMEEARAALTAMLGGGPCTHPLCAGGRLYDSDNNGADLSGIYDLGPCPDCVDGVAPRTAWLASELEEGWKHLRSGDTVFRLVSQEPVDVGEGTT